MFERTIGRCHRVFCLSLGQWPLNTALGGPVKVVVLLTGLVLGATCLSASAEGWADVTGTAASGQVFDVIPSFVDSPGTESPGDPFSSFTIYVKAEVEPKSLEFRNEPCVMSHDPISGIPLFFGCSESSASPLKGVMFIAERNPLESDCTYSVRFVCVRGCDGPSVPRVLTRKHWECTE